MKPYIVCHMMASVDGRIDGRRGMAAVFDGIDNPHRRCHLAQITDRGAHGRNGLVEIQGVESNVSQAYCIGTFPALQAGNAEDGEDLKLIDQTVVNEHNVLKNYIEE